MVRRGSVSPRGLGLRFSFDRRRLAEELYINPFQLTGDCIQPTPHFKSTITTTMGKHFTVGEYLLERLVQIGVKVRLD